MNDNNTCTRSCVDCGPLKCLTGKGEYPEGACLTENLDEKEKETLVDLYDDPANHNVMINAAQLEYEGYGRLTRVEETIEFARRMGFKRIGIATCVGLMTESRILARLLRESGFEVFGAACKAGAIDKEAIGIASECKEVGSTMCNPIYQARALEKAKTDMNIVVGLCVGHDSLFYKYSKSLTTTLIVKDRVTGHNPAAVLYTANGYYKDKLAKITSPQ